MGLNPAVAFFARVILRPFGAVLFCFSVCSSHVFATEKCESEIRTVQVLVQMVHNALAAEELNIHEVTQQFSGGKWSNPFASQSKGLQNLDRRKAFANVSKQFTDDQKQEFRSRLLVVIGALAQEKKQVAVATETQAYIFLPKVFAEIPHEFDGSGLNLFAMSVIDGRPIFVGLMSKHGISSEYLVDYFRTDDPEKKLLPIGGRSKVRDSFDGVGKIFSWNGSEYFVRMESQTFLNLRTRENAISKFTKLKPPSQPGNSNLSMELKGWHVLEMPSGPVVAAAWNANQTELTSSFLGFVNLNSSAYTFAKTATGDTRSDINVARIRDRAIVSWIPRGENRVHFYRVSESSLDPIGSPQVETSKASFERKALVYESRDKLLAVIPYDFANTKFQKLGIFDVRDGFLRDIQIPEFETRTYSLDLVLVNGRQMLEVVGQEKIHLVDLVTEKVITHTKVRHRSDVATFQFRGRTFLLWGTEDSKLEVHDAETGLLVGSLHIGISAIQVLPFEFGGEPFAFVPRAGKAPIIVRLMDNGQEFKW